MEKNLKKSIYIYTHKYVYTHIQFSSLTQSCVTLCDPRDCSMLVSIVCVYYIHQEVARIRTYYRKLNQLYARN